MSKKMKKTKVDRTTAVSKTYVVNNAVQADIEGLIRKIQVLEPFLEFVKRNSPDTYRAFFNVKELPRVN